MSSLTRDSCFSLLCDKTTSVTKAPTKMIWRYLKMQPFEFKCPKLGQTGNITFGFLSIVLLEGIPCQARLYILPYRCSLSDTTLDTMVLHSSLLVAISAHLFMFIPAYRETFPSHPHLFLPRPRLPFTMPSVYNYNLIRIPPIQKENLMPCGGVCRA